MVSVEEMYVRSLHHGYTDYVENSTQQLLAHMFSTYANILPADLQGNNAKLRAPYDANHPVKNHFDQVENAVEYAAARKTPYSPEYVVTISFKVVFQTGLFLEDCKTWKRLPADSKTWATLTTFFATSHQEWRELQVTTAGFGFQLANHLYQQEMVDAISNLATDMAIDRASVVALAMTKSTITAKVAASHAKLVVALQDNVKLASTITYL